ncbi:IclR family transcriptional regulator [Nocardioides sp. LHG3406-4]|uniref:IclR family transcriptional regulator n=1 Tax=Nocardioides sp. LHG3406-4 TaxID=2804575 RepID=UPI003CFA2F50
MSEPAQPPKSRPEVARSVLLAFTLLEAVAELQPVSLGDLSRQLKSPKSTILRSLRTLRAAGYIYQDPAGAHWSLTLRCLRLADAATSSLGLASAARPVMEALSMATEEGIHLSVLECDAAIVVEKVDGRRAVRAHTARGERLPIHASSSGKVFLSSMSEREVEGLLPVRLERFTETTITTVDALREELEQVRRAGYATNDGERRIDVLGVAAPIRDSSGSVVAAIGVSFPRERLKSVIDFQRIVRECQAAADEISGRMGG